VKYYVYISDAKVDMLLPQISDAHKKKVATEFGFDVKIFSAKRKVEAEANEDRIARLETVLSFIREFGNLGTVEKPDEYIEDTLPMYFVDLNPTIDERCAYFTGKQLDTVVGLGGSWHHVLGAGKPQSVVGHSLAYRILNMIKTDLAELPEDKSEEQVSDHTAYVIDHAFDSFRRRGPVENLRFMAKRLVSEKNERGIFVLGSPLYVAKDD
jgi:hypothetical protein